jgi:flagellar protein FliO/FliZ
MGTEYVHVVLSLGLVVGLMLLFFYFMKKFRTLKINKNKHINIINAISIGPKEKIILIEVNNAILLLGATPSHIETLYVFNDLESTKPKITDPDKSTFVDQMKELSR